MTLSAVCDHAERSDRSRSPRREGGSEEAGEKEQHHRRGQRRRRRGLLLRRVMRASRLSSASTRRGAPGSARRHWGAVSIAPMRHRRAGFDFQEIAARERPPARPRRPRRIG